MHHSSRSYLSTSAQFSMPSTIENNSSFSQCERSDTIHFANDNVSIPMSPYFGNCIHQPEMVSLPGISNHNTGTRNIQHHSSPTYIAGISSIERMHVTASVAGLMKNAEDERDAPPSEPPPSYNELFGRKPNTVDAATSMDTTTITITRTITVPMSNRINTNRHERPAVNYPAYNHHIPNDKTITCTCVTIRVFVIGTLFFAVYYITTSVMYFLTGCSIVVC